MQPLNALHGNAAMQPEQHASATPVFGVTGWKNAGKTTLVAALVAELTARGFVISTIKHAHHRFDIDHEGRDSWRHRKAGARETALVSSARWALMHELGDDESEPDLDEIIAKMAPCDLILIEGYKREMHDKIEILRGDAGSDKPLWPDDPGIVALAASETPPGCSLPVISTDDTAAIADFIVTHCGLSNKTGRHHAAE